MKRCNDWHAENGAKHYMEPHEWPSLSGDARIGACNVSLYNRVFICAIVFLFCLLVCFARIVFVAETKEKRQSAVFPLS